MSQNESEKHLRETLKKLETASERMTRTQGYTHESKKIRLLIELIREQISNENTLSSASPLR